MNDSSTTSPDKYRASEMAELSTGQPGHLSLSPAPSNAYTNKEDRIDATIAGEGLSPNTLDASSNEMTKFDPGYRFYLAFLSLAVLAMMVSLDGTSVSVALPVRLLPFLRLQD